MLQDVHTKKLSIPVIALAGATTVIVPAHTDAWIYVHEVMGDLSGDGTLEILSGTTSLAKFDIDAGQGITENDEPGMDGVSRFECKPGDAFIIKATGGDFKGTVDYSLRY